MFTLWAKDEALDCGGHNHEISFEAMISGL